jgi:hypothetical protein
MKTLLLFIVLAISPLASAQTPILELRDDTIVGRKLIVFSDNRYQFFSFPGTRPFEGIALFEQITECQVRFATNQATHSISAKVNRCNSTGKATLDDFVNATTYTITDKTKE